jgi:hypothetical protein
MTITTQLTNKIKHLTTNEVEKLYLSYVNDFITIENFCNYYNISYYSAKTLINTMRNKSN